MACEDKTIEIKTGSDANFTMLYTDNSVEPEPISLDGYTISMDFIDQKTGNVLKECSTEDGSIVITEVVGQEDTTGTYAVYGGNTLDWQVGLMPVDIKYTVNGSSQHTQDFFLKIVKGRSQ